MDNFKTYLFNGPVMQNFGKLLSLPAGSSQRDLTSPLPHLWSDHSQALEGTAPSLPAPALNHKTSHYSAATKPNAFGFTLRLFQKNKIWNMSQTLYRSGISKSFTAHYEMVYFKTWIKLFYVCPKTSFPPQRAFRLSWYPVRLLQAVAAWEPRELWGVSAECSVQGQQPPQPCLPLPEETSSYFKNINNHLDSTQMLLCNITALNNMS